MMNRLDFQLCILNEGLLTVTQCVVMTARLCVSVCVCVYVCVYVC